MTVTLTRSQMLEAWRRRAGLEPLNRDCTIERFDGIDADAVIAERMRQWYLDLLDNGDLKLIGSATEASSLVKARLTTGNGSAVIETDPSVRRLLTIRLSGWERSAAVVDRSDAAGLIGLQDNRYSRAGTASPLAYRDEAGLVIATPATGVTVISAMAIIDPGADTYILDERALDSIPSIFNP